MFGSRVQARTCGLCGERTWPTLPQGYFSKAAVLNARDDLYKVMTKPALMVGLGEMLWDVLPSGKVLGGAPANFAYMTNVLGNQGIVASRIGNDALGCEA